MGRTSLRDKVARKHSPAAITAARQDAFAKMPSRLATLVQRIERRMSDSRSENLRFYYDVGKLVLQIRNNPEDYEGTDGTSGMQLLSQALSTQSRTLRKAANFAESYSDRELNELIGLQHRETGFQLHWGHVSYLLSLETTEERWRFTQEAVSKMLDPPALHELIKKKKQRSGGHGRTHKVPATLTGQVQQIVRVTSAWNGKQENVWNGEAVSVLNNLLEASGTDVSDELLVSLRTAREAQQQMAEAAAANVATFDRIIERYEGLLKQKADEAAAAEQSAAASADRLGGREARSVDIDPPERRASRATSRARREQATSAA